MKLGRILTTAAAIIALASSAALATPTGQIWIPSTDAKGFKDVTFNRTNIARFSTAADAGPNYYDVGVVAGVLPFEAVKMEIGMDYLTTGTKIAADNYPMYFNAKLATAEDLGGYKWMPAFAVGVYNLGTHDKPEMGLSTRQNLAYGLVAKTIPVIGRISAGGYYGSSRALANGSNFSGTDNNSGTMISWDRAMPEISDKLWLAIDYMSGNNGNGQIGFGGSWTFSKNITLLVGGQIFNPGYKPGIYDDPTGAGPVKEALPGGKPAFTTQLFINF
jgi:hypothetical protein